MTPDLSPDSIPSAPPIAPRTKQPRLILQEENSAHPYSVFAFPPNRDTLGGTAYLIVETVNILVDCPPWDAATHSWLQEKGGVQWLFFTHRNGIGKSVKTLQQELNCQILIQEQEAYLLPGLTVTTFEQEFQLSDHSRAIWTPGHSPGSACLYCDRFGGGLFSGRHLLPNPQGRLMPIRTPKTFHWGRQQRSVQALRDRFTPETLRVICPGANTGFLRGQHIVEQAYAALTSTPSP
ncbi:MBL fold metallo-hydrolase [Pantanalinema rosaneae CENA516]|uniref:MBL fold metallo-hydrolase n=1 Tax=Pantanalinema rosaneae TaxID=1620701 RepID=UPI003D6E55BA